MYTPLEVGFWTDPAMRDLAEKVQYPDVGAAIARLREFIMLVGTHDGALPGRSRDQIAVVMESNRAKCSRAAFFKALSDAGYLKCRRKTYYYPDWPKTPMGKYCKERKVNAEQQAELRRRKRLLALAELEDGHEKSTSGGRRSDVPLTSSGVLEGSKDSRPPDGPPRPPRRGAEKEALTRWEWFEKTYPRLRNRAVCVKVLAELSKEDWAQLQYALPIQVQEYVSRKRKFVPPADKYLREEHFLELRRERPRKAEPRKPTPKVDPKAEAAEKRKKSLLFLKQQLADADLPEEAKEKAKDHWFKTYGDRPWEKGEK